MSRPPRFQFQFHFQVIGDIADFAVPPALAAARLRFTNDLEMEQGTSTVAAALFQKLAARDLTPSVYRGGRDYGVNERLTIENADFAECDRSFRVIVTDGGILHE